MPASSVRLTTADGERLAAEVLPGPAGAPCVVLAHGFSGATTRPPVRRVARALGEHATVLAYDARGHGASTGRTTLGDLEVLDVDAAVRAARGLGHERVVTCGWSMGGAAVLRHAALRGTPVAGHRLDSPPDAVVAVSTTSRWSVRATATGPLRRLHAVVETRPGRAYARRVMRTRVSETGWDPVPAAPLDLVGRIAPLPLLLVHGDRDAYFPLEHPRALQAAAGEPCELWLEPGFAHAETAATPDLLDRLGRHLPELLAQGADRPASTGDAFGLSPVGSTEPGAALRGAGPAGVAADVGSHGDSTSPATPSQVLPGPQRATTAVRAEARR